MAFIKITHDCLVYVLPGDPDLEQPLLEPLQDGGASGVRDGIAVGERLGMDERDTRMWYLVARVFAEHEVRRLFVSVWNAIDVP